MKLVISLGVTYCTYPSSRMTFKLEVSTPVPDINYIAMHSTASPMAPTDQTTYKCNDLFDQFGTYRYNTHKVWLDV